ncbi:MAG: DUF2892 domain-containing protein [Gemmataceae bacterium]|nr:DUF2892 domain-containing protein [Gemmataceae bacterium]
MPAMTTTAPETLAVASGPHTQPARNVGDSERLISAAAGGIMTLYGLSRGSLGGLALAALGGSLLYRGATGHCSLFSALGLSTADPHGPLASVAAGSGAKVEKSITIDRPAEQLYRYWRDLGNLPRFMDHIESVTGEGVHSHWVARGPMGATLQWDAEIINDRPNELIAWRSLPGADVDSAGAVHFQPMEKQGSTRVVLNMKYDPPAGKLGTTVARLLGFDPEAQVEENLQRFKQLMEGEKPASTRGQSSPRKAHEHRFEQHL